MREAPGPLSAGCGLPDGGRSHDAAPGGLGTPPVAHRAPTPSRGDTWQLALCPLLTSEGHAEPPPALSGIALRVLEARKPLHHGKVATRRRDGADNSAASLHQRVKNSLKTVELVATGSANLKGTFVRALKTAVASIGEAVDDLKERTSSEETRRLQRQNAKLRAEVTDLRSEVEELKAELRAYFMKRAPPSSLSKEAPQPATAPPGRSDADELVGAITARVGRMLDERLGALERDGRLLPAKPEQPPPAADRGRQEEKGQEECAETVSEGHPTESPLPPATEPPRPAAATSTDEGWKVAVGGRKKRRKAAATKAKAPQPAPQRAKPKARRLRPPRSAAVVLTLQPEAEANGATYAKVLAVAKDKVKLSDLGISDLRFRRAATGARILQLPGVNSGVKADKLARELAEKLGEEVRVSRPTKCAELRLSNLDDSVTSEEVVAAVARVGECTQDQVKAGEIRRDHTGLGTVWVRCPVTAAKKVSDGGRFLVGWSSAQVKLLEPRILRCYRCLEVGHVRAQCQAQIDRGSLCYRCGKPDHKAAQCSAEPHCAVCEASGKSASHALGSKACTARGPRKDRKTRDGPRPPRSLPSRPRQHPRPAMRWGKQWPLNK
ncbi:uncharacterized protein LOC125241345 [Leguminivora glycinivorella]|uniref:uncharacterized protein LOC125241345 n=1 Tax=Leguminivora glycinivorella TaxID=1035111 RepID=UPI00200CA4AE|nr:uncharacterized protein LOC125241345 [Leguminivora glycinivorella]